MSSPVVSRHRVVGRAPHVEPALSPPPPVTRITGRYRFDRRTGAWWWSHEMFTLHGLPPGSVPPDTEEFVRYQHAEDRERVLDAISTACTTGRDFALETRIIRADGQERDVVLVGEAQMDGAGWSPPSRAWPSTSPSAIPPVRPTERAQALQAEVGQLRAAMASRAAIEQAKGILMLLTSCSEQVAFDLLAHISSHTHRKVRDVARGDHRVGGRPRPAPGRRPRDHPRRLPADTAPPVGPGTAGSSSPGVVREQCGCTPPTRPSARAPRPRGGETRRGLPHRPVRPATAVPAPPAARHRPGERARHRRVHHREQPPVLHRQHGHPAHVPAPGRLPGQGGVLHRPPASAGGSPRRCSPPWGRCPCTGTPTAPRRRRSTPR